LFLGQAAPGENQRINRANYRHARLNGMAEIYNTADTHRLILDLDSVELRLPQ